MVLITIFLASMVMAFSGAVMPGPLLTVTIRESMRHGVKAGPQIVTGHALLELLLVFAISIGLGEFIMWSTVKGTIGIVGGLFLFWMAYGIIREAWDSPDLNLEGSIIGKKGIHPILLGVTVSASNPYWTIWWVTVGAGSLILVANNGVAGVVSFYLGHITADYIWYILVAAAVTGGKRFIKPIVYRIILGACGLFLFGLAGYFFFSGLAFWGIISV
ncbi:MAG: LysE family transporter [Desulfosporosinus sp.]